MPKGVFRLDGDIKNDIIHHMSYLLDTNVLVAAFRSSTGASHALVRRALSGDLPLVVHHKLVYEYRDVLSRPETLQGSGLSFADVELVLAHLVISAATVDVRYLWRPNLPDEGDNFVMEVAIAAWPCTIVTHNIADFSRAELRFPQVPLVTPGELMQSLTH
jgi:predicted nucleic acid-binding protein